MPELPRVDGVGLVVSRLRPNGDQGVRLRRRVSGGRVGGEPMVTRWAIQKARGVSRTEWVKLHAMANKMSVQARLAFITAIGDVRENVGQSKLAAAIRAGDKAAAKALIADAIVSPSLDKLSGILVDTFEAAMGLSATALAERIDVQTSFNLTNPKAIQWAEKRAAKAVVEVTKETKKAIRAAVARGFKEEIVPRETAKAIMDVVGLTERQAIAVFNYRATLLAEGADLARVQVQAERYAARLLKYRANVIASQETLMASNKGQEALWSDAKESGELPASARRIWIVTSDDRLCPLCETMEDKEAAIDGTWETDDGAVETPQELHVGCRCAEGLAFE